METDAIQCNTIIHNNAIVRAALGLGCTFFSVVWFHGRVAQSTNVGAEFFMHHLGT